MSLDRINLLNEKKAEKKPWTGEQLALLGYLGVFLLSAGLVVSESRAVDRKMADKLSAQKSQAEIKEKLTLFASQSASNDARKIATVQNFISSKVQWAGLLHELSLLAPRDFWLTSIQGEATNGIIRLFISGEATSQSLFSDFSISLEESFYFRNVKLKSSERVEGVTPPVYKFQFECTIAKYAYGKGGSEK